jgi:hypothetical protein
VQHVGVRLAEGSCYIARMNAVSLAGLSAFREQIAQQFERRADALYEMLDALLAYRSGPHDAPSRFSATVGKHL